MNEYRQSDPISAGSSLCGVCGNRAYPPGCCVEKLGESLAVFEREYGRKETLKFLWKALTVVVHEIKEERKDGGSN